MLLMAAVQAHDSTWLIGTTGLGAIFGLLAVMAVLVTGGAGFFVLQVLDQPTLMIAVAALGVSLFALLMLLSSTLTAIYRAALYRYAVDGAVAEQFDQTLINDAFRRRGF